MKDRGRAIRPAAAEFGAGLVAVVPLLLGAIPFGLVYGVLAVKAGIPPALAIATSVIVFAGSAQLLITQLVTLGTPAGLIVLSVAVINLRHALYSAALALPLRPLSMRWKVVLAYLLTDEAYAAALTRFASPAEATHRHWFLFGCGFGLWAVWQAACIVGVMLGSEIPAGWSLEFAGTLTFIAIVIPLLTDRAAWTAMLTAGFLAIACAGFPYQLAIVAAAIGGMLAGSWLDREREPCQ